MENPGGVIKPSVQWATAAENCVRNGDVQTLCKLLRRGTGTAAERPDYATRISLFALEDKLFELDPIHLASALGHREVVWFLSTQIAPWAILVHDREAGETPLHTCARFGRVQIASDLLRYGAPVCATDSENCNALHIACEHDNEDLVRLLLDAGSPVDRRDKNGCTPLFTSVRAGGSPRVQQLLIARGADVDAASDGEPTALALAAGMGCLTTVRLLASAGADLLAAAKNLDGETPLHLAAKNGSENVLRFLLAAGCWAETKDDEGRTPLASACASGRTGTAAVLLTGEGWGLDRIPQEVHPDLRHHVLSFLVATPENPDKLGNTPLLAACEHRGTPEVLDLLATHGADFGHTNASGESALHVACRRGNAALAHHLLGCRTFSRTTRKFIVEASVSATDCRGRRPGEVRDIGVGVHEALAAEEVVARARALMGGRSS